MNQDDDSKGPIHRRVSGGAEMHPDVARLHLEIQQTGDRLVELRGAVEEMAQASSPDKLKAVIVASLREAAQDPAITRAVYETMTRHARSSLAQYIGERVLTALAVLAISAALAWSYITGHIK